MKFYLQKNDDEQPSVYTSNKLKNTIKFCSNDPRSPSTQLDRTPLVLDEISVLEPEEDDCVTIGERSKSTDLNMVGKESVNLTLITEGDLRDKNDEETIENRSNFEDACSNLLDDEKEENSFKEDTDSESKISVSSKQQEFDPRSPSLGVERTPIIFAEEDGSDVSGGKKFDFQSSFEKVQDENISVDSGKNLLPADNDDDENSSQTFHSRLLSNRMRNYRKMRKNKHFFNRLHNHRYNKEQQKIYEDQDSENDPKLPRKQLIKKINDIATESPLKCKRNPLIAMDNCTNLRLRSLDVNARNSDV